jgi:hypothetical protein
LFIFSLCKKRGEEETSGVERSGGGRGRGEEERGERISHPNTTLGPRFGVEEIQPQIVPTICLAFRKVWHSLQITRSFHI